MAVDQEAQQAEVSTYSRLGVAGVDDALNVGLLRHDLDARQASLETSQGNLLIHLEDDIAPHVEGDHLKFDPHLMMSLVDRAPDDRLLGIPLDDVQVLVVGGA